MAALKSYCPYGRNLVTMEMLLYTAMGDVRNCIARLGRDRVRENKIYREERFRAFLCLYYERERQEMQKTVACSTRPGCLPVKSGSPCVRFPGGQILCSHHTVSHNANLLDAASTHGVVWCWCLVAILSC